jgi:GH25 family lysozyme M1 (1,4-beta-N-acetylmuramidase)
MIMKQGIDVSKWQKGFDFKLARQQGKTFCIVRAGKTTSDGRQVMDEAFYDNINRAKNAGLDIGIYFYSLATTPAIAVREADWIHKLLNSDLRNTALKSGIWIDVEDSKQAKLSPERLTSVIMAGINRLNSCGHYVGLYSSCSFFRNNLVLKNLPGYIPLWVAQYGKENTLKKLYPRKQIPCWQYSDKGKIGKFQVDLNVWY